MDRRVFTALAFPAVIAFVAAAQTPPAAQSERFPAPPAVEKIEKTQHSIQINGRAINYTATAGTLVLKKDDSKPLASVFFVAYTRDDIQDKSQRPLTFAFNGGPGSARSEERRVGKEC